MARSGFKPAYLLLNTFHKSITCPIFPKSDHSLSACRSFPHKHKIPGKQFKFGTHHLDCFACFISSNFRARRGIRFCMEQNPSFGDKESVKCLIEGFMANKRRRYDSKLVSHYQPNGLITPHRIPKALSKRTHAGGQLACPYAASLVVKTLK